MDALPELNAVLAQYRVFADTGADGSRIKRGGGLVFRVLDQHGRSIGVPVKASDFHFKPTLRALQERFSAGKLAREKHAVRLRNTIDKAIASGYFPDLSSLQAELKSDGVVIDRVIVRLG